MNTPATIDPDPYPIIYRELKRTAEHFRRQPFDAQYESDIRSYLFVRLFDAFDDYRIDLKSRLKEKHKEYTENHRVNVVRTEYPSSTRFDIALLDRNSILIDNWWNQAVSIAIELKFWQADGTGGSFETDIDKLTAYRKPGDMWPLDCGLAILFVQPGGAAPWPRLAPDDWKYCEPCTSLNPGIWLHVIELKSAEEGWRCLRRQQTD